LSGTGQGLAGDLEEAAFAGDGVHEGFALVPLFCSTRDVALDAVHAAVIPTLTIELEGRNRSDQVGGRCEDNGSELHGEWYLW